MPRKTAKTLRKFLKNNGRKYECEKCGIKQWNGIDLVIEVHHKDGNGENNLLENLELLCPNCHSQTDNFRVKRGKYNCKICNIDISHYEYATHRVVCDECVLIVKQKPKMTIRKVKRPEKEVLEKEIWEISTIQLSKKYGVSDKAISKWCKWYNIPKPPRGYWAKKQHNKL